MVAVLALVITAGWFWQARQTRIVRDLATEKSKLAKEKSSLASTNARLAEANRERVVRLDIANGVRLMDEGDFSGALLWFADALPLVTNNPPWRCESGGCNATRVGMRPYETQRG